MFTVADIIGDVLAWWGRPSEQELPPRDVIRIVNRKVNRLLLIAQVSDRNYLAKLSDSFTFNGAEMTREVTDISDLSSIVRVESRSVGSDDQNWSEEIVGNYGAWNDAMDRGVDQVAFYGNGDSLVMAVNRPVQGLEFRIMYETGGVSLSSVTASVPALEDFFRGVIFYGTAAEAGMQLVNLNGEESNARDKKVSFALGQEQQSTKDFERWVLNTPGQSVTFREAFNSSREGSGRPRMFNSNSEIAGYFSRY